MLTLPRVMQTNDAHLLSGDPGRLSSILMEPLQFTENKVTDMTKTGKLKFRNGKIHLKGGTLPLQQGGVMQKAGAGGEGVIVFTERYSTTNQPNTTSCPILNAGLEKPGVDELGLIMDSALRNHF